MKLGIIGTGKIVCDALYAMEPIQQIRCNAIFARPHSKEKGEALAAEYAIPAVYTDYDELLEHADVDCVYIGLVNRAHYAYAKKALEKHKNVILEKPFVGTLAEAEDLIRYAKEQDCFIFEAITVLHNDVIEKMRADLPKLGRIRMMQANFSQYSSRYDRYLDGQVEPSFDPENYGGALRDINVYNIHYAVALLGSPKRVQYFPNTGFNGVDTSGTLVMEYPGYSAVCNAAKDSDSPCFVCIQGEKGYMRINGKPNVAPKLITVLAEENSREQVMDPAGATVRGSTMESFIPEEPHHRMTQEFRDFSRIIDDHDTESAERLSEETLAVMRVIEKASAAADTVFLNSSAKSGLFGRLRKRNKGKQR